MNKQEAFEDAAKLFQADAVGLAEPAFPRTVEVEDAEARNWKPTVVFVDGQNRIREQRDEVPGPVRKLA